MRQIDFNDLPRTTRERFVRSLVSGSKAAAPICQRVSRPRRPVAWYLLLVVTLAAVAVAVTHQFGSSTAPVQDRRWLGFYIVASGLIGLSFSMLARRRALKGSLPFTPGIYVFPLDLVDARTRELELHPLGELQTIDLEHHHKRGRYTHSTLWFVFPETSFVFDVKGREKAEAQLTAIHDVQQAVSAASYDGPSGELATHDPFADARARDFLPTNDFGLLARGRPIWTRFIWAITIVCGLTVGVGTWRLRNWQSDERVFARLHGRSDTILAETYVKAGGLRAAEVKSAIIPGVRLAEAKKEAASKRAEALDRFLKAYPGSSVDAEARALLRETLHAEFAAQITVSGMRAFVARWPDAPDAFAAQTRIRELYAESAASLRQRAASAPLQNVLPVLEAMLVFAEERHVPFAVRFRRRTSAIAMTDRLLAKGLLDDDGAAAPAGNAEASPHFAGEESRARERAIAHGLEAAFRGVFPADPFVFELGPAIGDPKAPLEEVAAPTLVVDYVVSWSGATFVARDLRRRFLGVQLAVDVVVQLPKDPRVLAFSFKTMPPDSLPVDWTGNGAPFGGAARTDDAVVYDAIVIAGFEASGPRLGGVLFDPPKPFASR